MARALHSAGRIVYAVIDAAWPTFVSTANVALTELYIAEVLANAADWKKLVASLSTAGVPPGVTPPPPWTVEGSQVRRSNGTLWTPATWGAETVSEAVAHYDRFDETGRITRAIVLVLIDELNILRQWIAAFKVQVAAATTLADLKTRVAGLPATPDRTGPQAKTSIVNKLNSGA